MCISVFKRVYDSVRQVPFGMVVIYGDIAKIVGLNPRYVGYILHQNPYPGEVLCHRVVNSQGKVATNFAFGGGKFQKQMLEIEGVVFVKDKLDLCKYRYGF